MSADKELIERLHMIVRGESLSRIYGAVLGGDPFKADMAHLAARLEALQPSPETSLQNMQTRGAVGREDNTEIVWRVCRTIRGDCNQCPEVQEVGGESCMAGCYLQAVECINVVETGNPWRRTEGVGAPWVTVSSSPTVEGWQPISTAPKDGTHFLAWVIDLVDEYDERDRLIARNVPTPHIVIAYSIFGSADFVQYPWNGGMPQGRRYALWQPLPPAPTTEGK